jgi:hypothetical protein
MTRSNFPKTVDSLPELSNVLASDQVNIDRYKTLLMQATRTTSEETELSNLKVTLANKIISAEYFNFLSDAIVATQDYFLTKVMDDISKLDIGILRDDIGFPSDLTTIEKSNLVNAVNELHSRTGLLTNLKTASTANVIVALNEVYDLTNKNSDSIDVIEDTVNKIANDSVTYITPTLLNAWVTYALAYPPKYWKDNDGMVHYQFPIGKGGSTSSTAVLRFPEGYRPSFTLLRDAYCDSTPSTRVLYTIDADGYLKWARSFSSNSLVILSGSFKAVNSLVDGL